MYVPHTVGSQEEGATTGDGTEKGAVDLYFRDSGSQSSKSPYSLSLSCAVQRHARFDHKVCCTFLIGDLSTLGPGQIAARIAMS